jgi:hypothetical protein
MDHRASRKRLPHIGLQMGIAHNRPVGAAQVSDLQTLHSAAYLRMVPGNTRVIEDNIVVSLTTHADSMGQYRRDDKSLFSPITVSDQ